MMHRDQLIPQV